MSLGMENDSELSEVDEWAEELERDLEVVSNDVSQINTLKRKLQKDTDASFAKCCKVQKRPCFVYILPKEILRKIFQFVSVGKVCKIWTDSMNEVIRDKFHANLTSVFEQFSMNFFDISRSIENELFSLCNQRISKKYNQKARRLLFNLKDRKNDALRSRVLNGDILPCALVRMKANDMANPILVQQRKDWIKKRTFEVTRDLREVDGYTVTDMFTCPSCGEKRTRYRQMRRKAIVDRTRIIVICLQCPNQWDL